MTTSTGDTKLSQKPSLSNDGWIAECQELANAIRVRVLSHVVKSGGYLSQACSAAEAFAVLYGRGMNLGPSEGEMVPPAFQGAALAGGSAVGRVFAEGQGIGR